MQLRPYLAFCLVCLAAAAQDAGTVGDLVADVRNDIQHHRKDSQMAKILRKIRLTERLDDRIVEILQSEGAGPETVAQLWLLRDASAKLSKPARPAIDEPPAPSPAEQQAIWAAAQANAESYMASLPDFLCNEVVRRYTDPNEKGAWRLADTYVLRLAYVDGSEDYQPITVNNRSTRASYAQLRMQMGGAISEGEFGSTLAEIFALKSRTNRQWDHWTILRGRPAHVYAFSISPRNSSYTILMGLVGSEGQRVPVGRRGFLYVDAETKKVMRIVSDIDGMADDFPVRHANSLLDYGMADVGGREYLVPLHAEITLDAPPEQHRNEIDFLQYKKFTTDSSISYGKK